jgi:hypothetical protein
MKIEWLQHTVLRVASLLAPGDQRAEWVKEWRSELWYIPQRQAMRFSLGAFRDALWLRRNNMSSAARPRIHLESPLRCLALLAVLAAVSIFIWVRLLALAPEPSLHLRARNLPTAYVGMLMVSCLFLTGTLPVWRLPATGHPMPYRNRLRRGIFLALKIALVQPMMLCVFVLQFVMGPLAGFVGLGFNVAFILVLRWVITDQQQRCPVCLRLLTAPIRIGTPSRTFLEWYGAESTCSRGHGLLHVSETASSFTRRPQWLSLDDSWSDLFPGQATRSGNRGA